MHQWLVPHVVLPLYERLTGRRPWTGALRLRELQWWPREELEARTLLRLRGVLGRAATRVPYYRDLFTHAGVAPEDVITLSALSRLPITMKADLRAASPDRTLAEGVPATRRWRTSTSGATGVPFAFYADRAGMDSWLASHLFFLDWIGAAIWTPRIDIFGPPGREAAENIPGSAALPQLARFLVLGERAIAVAGVDLTLDGLRGCLDRFPRGRPYFIRANPAYAARLAAQLLAGGRALTRYPMVVMTGSETLTPVQEAAIRSAFGCRVVNHYSTWEVPHMAQSCPDNPALLHVNSERVVLRVVGDDGRDVGPGERGHVVVTALANDVMPLINYDLGDWGVAGGSCPCGRGFPTLAAIEGRSGEMIETPAGRAITPAMMTTQLALQCEVVGFISEYQAEQTAPDAVIFRVVPAPGFRTEMEETLRKGLGRLVGPCVAVSVEVVDRIPCEPSGKRPIIKTRKPSVGGLAPSADRTRNAPGRLATPG
jgi:phenylacetate-coenzyme A ligase PaaK-like adenylate-forming protein